MVMTLEISNMNKIYIFGTLMASEITWHMQFFPKLGLPKSLWLISLIDMTYFNINFVFFEKIMLGRALEKTAYAM